MIPSPAKPAKNANTPRPITMTPADLKKSGAYLELANDTELKESKESTGRVPRAKASIIRNPEIKDPLLSATTCMDWVNPQGRKNVPAPIITGDSVACSTFLKKEKRLLGSVSLLFAKIPSKLNPSKIMTEEAISPNIAEKVKFIPMAFPINPSMPPKKAKPTNLPA